jgi:hypothetical protein
LTFENGTYAMSRVKTFDSGKFEEGKLINLMQKREKRKNREERKILYRRSTPGERLDNCFEE